MALKRVSQVDALDESEKGNCGQNPRGVEKRAGRGKEEKQESGVLGARGGECFQKRAVSNLSTCPLQQQRAVFTCHIGRDLFIYILNNNT